MDHILWFLYYTYAAYYTSVNDGKVKNNSGSLKLGTNNLTIGNFFLFGNVKSKCHFEQK